MIKTVEINDKREVAVNESTWIPKNHSRSREWTTEGNRLCFADVLTSDAAR